MLPLPTQKSKQILLLQLQITAVAVSVGSVVDVDVVLDGGVVPIVGAVPTACPCIQHDLSLLNHTLQHALAYDMFYSTPLHGKLSWCLPFHWCLSCY